MEIIGILCTLVDFQWPPPGPEADEWAQRYVCVITCSQQLGVERSQTAERGRKLRSPLLVYRPLVLFAPPDPTALSLAQRVIERHRLQRVLYSHSGCGARQHNFAKLSYEAQRLVTM